MFRSFRLSLAVGLVITLVGLAWTVRWALRDPLQPLGDSIAREEVEPPVLEHVFQRFLSPARWTVVRAAPSNGASRYLVDADASTVKVMHPKLTGDLEITGRGDYVVGSLCLTPADRGDAVVRARRGYLRDFVERIFDRDQLTSASWILEVEHRTPREADWAQPRRWRAGSALLLVTSATGLEQNGFMLVSIKASTDETQARVDSVAAGLRLAAAGVAPKEGVAMSQSGGVAGFRSEESLEIADTEASNVMSRLASSGNSPSSVPQFVRLAGSTRRILKVTRNRENQEIKLTFQSYTGSRCALKATVDEETNDAVKIAPLLQIADPKTDLPGELRWSGQYVGSELDAEGTRIIELGNFAFEWRPK